MELLKIYFRTALVLLLFCLCTSATAENTILATDLQDKMRGMWLGQLIANAAGRATEGDYQHTPNPDPCVPWVIKEIWGGDDDTDLEYLAMHILEDDGLDCNNAEIAAQWSYHSGSSGLYIANLQAWSLIQDGYLPPETGSRTYNVHWYAIDSQIATESLGAISPGLPQAAIDLTGRFARISNDGFPVHAAQFYATMYAHAFFEPNIVNLINLGLDSIPSTSRTHKVISDVYQWYLQDAIDGSLDWRQTRGKLYDYYQGSYSYGRYRKWVESTINTGATALCLLYGKGDFNDTVQIGVLAGWDCDCNPATAGGLIGIINGYAGLPTDLTNPGICGDTYKNLYRPYIPNPGQSVPQYEAITTIAQRLTALAEENILANSGYITGTGEDKLYHIPQPGSVVPEPERPDPTEPNGLVAQAQEAGIDVTVSAAVEYHISSNDRRNLDAIIDGITDNSYNGHLPYYSYLSSRPETDWYQINFSKAVKFNKVVFYEGDLLWSSINTYYRNNAQKGGYFEDLQVEILRDGEFIAPAELSISPPLDRYKIYQTITFDFAPTVGEAVRIIGTAGGIYHYTTILELEAYGSTDPGLYVKSVQVAQDQQQRSSVRDVSVKFNRSATVTHNDVNLVGTTYGTIVGINENCFDYDDTTFTVYLSFAESLPDDTYQLKLDCSAITDQNGLELLDDDNNPADGYYSSQFHCLFGDSDGSATVDAIDLELFADNWLYSAGSTGLDANTNGVLDWRDFACFACNWLKGF